MGLKKAVLLAPHNDDEALWCAWTCLREHPHVIVCLRAIQQGNWARREIETAAAMKVLGCTWEQWVYSDTGADWKRVADSIAELADEYQRCYAPAPRFAKNGHEPEPSESPEVRGVMQHDTVGWLAGKAFPPERLTQYLTYTRYGGKDTDGVVVPFQPDWPRLKLQALACYESQLSRADTVEHFLRDQREYVL